MRARFEHSAGGVVHRSGADGPEVALAARRTRRGELAWGLPKGLIEPDETNEAAALREVGEETGLQAQIEADLGEIGYFYVWEGERIRKAVHFFLMRATGGDISRHDHEMEDVQWFPLEAALRAASFPSEREVIHRAAEAITERSGHE